MSDTPQLRATAFPHSVGAARLARLWVADEIRAMDLGQDRREEVALLISELVTNVVRHTDSDPVVSLRAERGRLVVGVADSSVRPAAVRDPDPDRPGGWGLRLVEQIADSWGTQHLDDGTKIVWFTVDYEQC